jgi:hypothetical protein
VRTCKRCGLEKPLTEFFVDRRKPEGRGYQCRLCRYQSEWERGYKNTKRYDPDPTIERPLQKDGDVVLSLCDRTGVMVQPWVEAGYRAIIVDIQHPAGVTIDGNVARVGADIRTWDLPAAEYRIAFAFPPCTHLSRAGNGSKRDKGLSALIQGLELVEATRRLCEATGATYMIENPVGALATYWRAPDHLFEPFEYGGYLDDGESQGYSKRTCLWTTEDFVMPERRPVPITRPGHVHKLGTSDARSVTPAGFARAVFEANVGRTDPSPTRAPEQRPTSAPNDDSESIATVNT